MPHKSGGNYKSKPGHINPKRKPMPKPKGKGKGK